MGKRGSFHDWKHVSKSTFTGISWPITFYLKCYIQQILMRPIAETNRQVLTIFKILWQYFSFITWTQR